MFIFVLVGTWVGKLMIHVILVYLVSTVFGIKEHQGSDQIGGLQPN